MNTAQVLAASLFITLFVSLVGYSVLSRFNQNPPIDAPLIVTSSVLYVDCTRTQMTIGNLRYEALTSVLTRLGLGGKNTLDTQLVVDAIATKTPTVNVSNTPYLIVYPPRGSNYTEFLTPWGNITAITRVVKPGDVYRVEGTSLTLLQYGPYSEYFGNLPVNPLPSQYSPPFKGSTRHTLSVSGTLISSYISTPGYAATRLLSGISRDDLFILARVKPNSWVENTDIPFYIDFYPGSQAFAYRADGRLYFTTGDRTITTVQNGSEVNIGLHSTLSSISAYINDDTSPRASGTPSLSTNIDLVTGVAREKEVKTRLGFVAYRYSQTSYHVVVFDYITGDYTFYDSSQPGNSRSGRAVTYSNTNSISISQGQFGYTPIVIVYNPTRGNSDWTLTIYTVEGTFSYYVQAVSSSKPITADFIVLWGDQVNPIFQTTDDDWRDHVVRVTVFSDGTSRIAVMTAKGGYQHDFYIIVETVNPVSGERVYTKPYGENWYYFSNGYYREIPNRIYFPSATITPGYISTHVYYFGVFRSPVLTVYGLFPGDVVILSTPNRAVSYEVDTSTLTVNLLTTFGPRELIEALRVNGGVSLIIRPSSERILSLMPTEGLIHARSVGVDIWIPISIRVSPVCSLSANTTSAGTAVLEKRGDFVRVILTDTQTGAIIRFGTYARVEGSLTGYTITIRYSDGRTETLTPNTVRNNIVLGPALQMVVLSDRAIFVALNGVIEIKDFSSITISNSIYRLTAHFGR